MLQYTPSKRNTGLVLWGDFFDLDQVADTIHLIVDKSPYIDHAESFVLGLAYDARKAKEGSRKKHTRTIDDLAYPVFGVEIVWPLFIIQLACLRKAVSYMDSTKHMQAFLYTLEDILEHAMKEIAPQSYANILQAYEYLQGASHTHLEQHYSSRCHYFLTLSPKKRIEQLPYILRSLDSMYDSLYPFWTRDNPDASKLVDPAVFREIEEQQLEWPDVKF